MILRKILKEQDMEDTIAAVATAYGEGGIGIVRISGNRAEEILMKIFQPSQGQKTLENRRLSYGVVKDPEDGSVIDECMAVFMKGPGTYTTEDVAEIDCHGSVVSLRKILSLVLRSGARLAEKGEFTKRAFLGGRIDLTQAEAVMDVVSAKTESGARSAVDQLEGRISRETAPLKEKLLDILTEIAVNIDYPDEDIEEMTSEKLKSEIGKTCEMVKALLETADAGRILREGISCTIAGRPNVGKSSLMNALLRESRAIVTSIPGTTRDIIEEGINIRGIPVKLIDTAGIHDTDDQIEKIGIEKSWESFEQADLLILMIDASSPLLSEDEELLKKAAERKSLVILNKKDLGISASAEIIRKRYGQEKNIKIIETSLTDGSGTGEIEEAVEEFVFGGKVYQKDSLVITNVRHKELLEQTLDALMDAECALDQGDALDFVEIDVRRAYQSLGEITGETVSDDIIDEVFSRFCLGK